MHFGQLESRVLEVRNRLAERLALLHVGSRPIDRRFGAGDGGHGDLQTLPRQLLHQAHEAAIFKRVPAEQVVDGHFDIIEKQFSRVLRFQSNLFQAFASHKSRHAAFDQQQAGALAARRRIGFRHHDHKIGMPTIGDECLGAVEKVMIPLPNCAGFHALQIGARRRLAHGNGAYHFTAGELRQIFFLLRLGAVMQ